MLACIRWLPVPLYDPEWGKGGVLGIFIRISNTTMAKTTAANKLNKHQIYATRTNKNMSIDLDGMEEWRDGEFFS